MVLIVINPAESLTPRHSPACRDVSILFKGLGSSGKHFLCWVLAEMAQGFSSGFNWILWLSPLTLFFQPQKQWLTCLWCRWNGYGDFAGLTPSLSMPKANPGIVSTSLTQACVSKRRIPSPSLLLPWSFLPKVRLYFFQDLGDILFVVLTTLQ